MSCRLDEVNENVALGLSLRSSLLLEYSLIPEVL